MLVLVSYDIMTSDKSDARRLRRISKHCLNYCQRVQYSVFEYEIEPAQWVNLKNNLIKEMNEEKDSLRFYFLGSNWKRRVEHIGNKKNIDLEEPLII